jgi:hypothetical protein
MPEVAVSDLAYFFVERHGIVALWSVFQLDQGTLYREPGGNSPSLNLISSERAASISLSLSLPGHLYLKFTEVPPSLRPCGKEARETPAIGMAFAEVIGVEQPLCDEET